MSKEIEVFVPGLPHTPGWVALSEKDKQWLQEHTSNAVDNFRQSGLRALQACAEMAMIESFLDGKPMTMTNWIQTCFRSSERTAWRWLARYKEMRSQGVTDEAILYLAKEGIAGVASIQTGDVVNVVKSLPPPKGTSERALSSWKDEVAEKLRTSRAGRAKGRKRKLDPEDAAKIGAVTLNRLLREAGIQTTKEAKQWLQWLGYLMDRRAIAGTLTVERTPAPEGWWPQVGRPRKTGKIAAGIVFLAGSVGIWWHFMHHAVSHMAAN